MHSTFDTKCSSNRNDGNACAMCVYYYMLNQQHCNGYHWMCMSHEMKYSLVGMYDKTTLNSKTKQTHKSTCWCRTFCIYCVVLILRTKSTLNWMQTSNAMHSATILISFLHSFLQLFDAMLILMRITFLFKISLSVAAEWKIKIRTHFTN